MNRAARIAGVATMGQVLCSSAVWESSRRARLVRRSGVTASSVGGHNLKGISDRIELYNVTVR